ncbi:MAG: Holliday junction resolvase RuvX [Sulfurospirillaceae bacterium]|nr:Holliday junction resolvase RuvX [Sulfurospirillaceae bacterium]
MKIASLDIGLKRIGIAISFDKKIVIPQDPIFRKNRIQASRDVDKFLNDWDIDILVVGVPKSGSSAEEMERRIKHFLSLLEFKNKIYFQDEYGTSVEAKEMMKGISKQKKDGKIDSLAAKLILERWLSQNSI